MLSHVLCKHQDNGNHNYDDDDDDDEDDDDDDDYDDDHFLMIFVDFCEKRLKTQHNMRVIKNDVQNPVCDVFGGFLVLKKSVRG